MTVPAREEFRRVEIDAIGCWTDKLRGLEAVRRAVNPQEALMTTVPGFACS